MDAFLRPILVSSFLSFLFFSHTHKYVTAHPPFAPPAHSSTKPSTVLSWGGAWDALTEEEEGEDEEACRKVLVCDVHVPVDPSAPCWPSFGHSAAPGVVSGP